MAPIKKNMVQSHVKLSDAKSIQESIIVIECYICHNDLGRTYEESYSSGVCNSANYSSASRPLINFIIPGIALLEFIILFQFFHLMDFIELAFF